MSSEQRSFVRVQVSFPVEVRFEDTVILVDAPLNLSVKGVQVATEQEIPMGTIAQVRIFVSVETPILAQARVERIGDGKIAFEFLGVDFGSFDLLREIVRYNADDPDQADREFQAHCGLKKRVA